MSYRNAKPIEWEPYKGEEIISNITIRKGKKIFEKEYYYDKAKIGRAHV